MANDYKPIFVKSFCFVPTMSFVVAFHPYIESVQHFLLVEAGLLTLFQSQTPSRLQRQWVFCLGCIKELTAAGQSEIFTHIPY